MVTLKRPPHGDRAADGVQRLRRHDAHGTREAARHQLRGQRHDVARLERRGCAAQICWGRLGYPLVMTSIAIEKLPFIVDFPMKNGDFP